MDQGDAAVWGAGISAVSTVVGGFFGYLAGLAQGRATVDGVKLQLHGQREDAVWQAEVDAVAKLVDQFNFARMQVANTIVLIDAPTRDRQRLQGLGYGTREEAFSTLTESGKACVSAENALRLRTAPAYADAATDVRKALAEVIEAVGAWAVARTGGPGNAAALRTAVDAKMDAFRSALDQFVEDSQARLSRSRPQ
ncbi:hypothetical protein [Streptomyces diastatochromogenes]|uniref:hypothetical protein n=1 Tax=Streptomyces diastatochromogenes TaxID=42236 RepID=UPI003685DAE7